jgi:hypothetical protein
VEIWEEKAEEERGGMCMEEGRMWWVQVDVDVDVQKEVKVLGSRVEKAEMKARAVCSWVVDTVLLIREVRFLDVCLWAITVGVD